MTFYIPKILFFLEKAPFLGHIVDVVLAKHIIWPNFLGVKKNKGFGRICPVSGFGVLYKFFDASREGNE